MPWKKLLQEIFIIFQYSSAQLPEYLCLFVQPKNIQVPYSLGILYQLSCPVWSKLLILSFYSELSQTLPEVGPLMRSIFWQLSTCYQLSSIQGTSLSIKQYKLPFEPAAVIKRFHQGNSIWEKYLEGIYLRGRKRPSSSLKEQVKQLLSLMFHTSHS